MLSTWRLLLLEVFGSFLASVAAMTPPVCMNSGGLRGGGTLLSDCSGHCDDGVLCDVAVDGQYTCLNYTESSFVLLIQDSGYVSDEDAAARVADASYMTKVSELPNDTGSYHHVDNCYLYDVAELTVDSSITQFSLAGGDTSRAFYKGRVGYINFNSNFIANQSQITHVSLVSLNLKDVIEDLPSKLPANLVQLTLKNVVIYNFPTQLSALSMLEELSLEGNYITALNESDVIPTLKTLNLASNNLTEFPASLPSNLDNLNLASNSIQEVQASDSSETLTLLNLTDNRIATFEAAFSSLETLYLGYNNLTEIPATVYSFTKLKSLHISSGGSALLSPVFTEDQFQFLQSLDTLDLTQEDFDSQAECASNNTQQLRSTIQVCLTSTASTKSLSTESSGMSTGEVIAIAAGGAVVVLVVVAVLIGMWRRRQRVAKYITAELDDPQLTPLMLKPGDIKDLQKIGAGAHAVVWLVRYRKSELLASKRLRKESRRQIMKAFIEEIKLVAPIDHPHIVKFVGIAWTVKTDIQALFEYVDNGTVTEYLVKPSTPREWTQQKLKIALDVAEALVYLHSFAPPILHRDLKAANVLLTSGMEAKVVKTGATHLRTAEGSDNDQRAVIGPWQAPEVLMGSQEHDTAVDIFSFGVFLSELDTHAAPFTDVRTTSSSRFADAVILQMIAAGSIGLRFGDNCPPDLRSLADLCLSKNPRARPAASEVVYALRTIRKML